MGAAHNSENNASLTANRALLFAMFYAFKLATFLTQLTRKDPYQLAVFFLLNKVTSL